MALVSLDQLARLPRENGAVAGRFGLSGVPGARTFVHVDKTTATPDANANYVPHFAGGRLGVVRTRCSHQEAAFDLLAELGGPARGAELIATPGLGAGPTRAAHLERDRLSYWLGTGSTNRGRRSYRTRCGTTASRRYGTRRWGCAGRTAARWLPRPAPRCGRSAPVRFPRRRG